MVSTSIHSNMVVPHCENKLTEKVMNVNSSEKTVHLVGSTSQRIEQTNTISTSETHLSESEQFLFNFRNKPTWVKIVR